MLIRPSFSMTPYACFKLFPILLILLVMWTCEKNKIPSQSLDDIERLEIQDNGNTGNASDIEVHFKKQFELANVKEYKIFAIKLESAAEFTMETANSLSADLYTVAQTSEVYPIKGKQLTATTVDTDGDLIVEGVWYQFAVLSVSKQPKEWASSLVFAEEAFELKNNSQIKNFTRQLEVGSGSLVMNEQEELFMADYNIHVHLQQSSTIKSFAIQKISKDGTVTAASDPYSLLSGNAMDRDGNLYQSVLFSGEILKQTPEGVTSVIEIQDAKLALPDGIHVDKDNTIFVVNQRSNAILKMTPNGETTPFAEVSPHPRGITGDEFGNLYVSHNDESGTITKITPDGTASVLATIPTHKPINYNIEFIMWVGYIVYQEGNLYVAGQSTDRIYKVGLDGTVSVFAGSGQRGNPRGGALTADLNRPVGLAFSKDGNSLFISGCTDVVPQHTQHSTPGKIWEIQLVEE